MAIVEREDYFNARLSCRADLAIISTIKNRISKKNKALFKQSCFGQFYNLEDVPFQGQLYLHLLFKQDKSMRGEKMVFHINNGETEFGPREFALVTGLKFGIKPNIPESSKFYKAVFGSKKKNLVVRDIEDAFMSATDEEDRDKLDEDMVIKLALLWILYGILLMKDNTTKKIDTQYIHLADDLNDFNKYPWGRVSYDFLKKDIRNSMDGRVLARRDRIKDNKRKNNITHIDVYGFAYALQFWAYEAIPCVASFCGGKKASTVNPRMLRWLPSKGYRFEEFTQHCFPILECGDETADRIKVKPNLIPTKVEKGTTYYKSVVEWEQSLKASNVPSMTKSRKRKRKEEDDEGGEGLDMNLIKRLDIKYRRIEKSLNIVLANQKVIMKKLSSLTNTDEGSPSENSENKRSFEHEDKMADETSEKAVKNDVPKKNEDKLDDACDPADEVGDVGEEMIDKEKNIGPLDDEKLKDEEMKNEVQSDDAFESAADEVEDVGEEEIDEDKNIGSLDDDQLKDEEVKDGDKPDEEPLKDEKVKDGDKPDEEPLKDEKMEHQDKDDDHKDEDVEEGSKHKQEQLSRKSGDAEENKLALQPFSGILAGEKSVEDNEFDAWFNASANSEIDIMLSVPNIGSANGDWFTSLRDPIGWLTNENIDALMDLLVFKAKTWPENYKTRWTCVDLPFWAVMTGRIYSVWNKAQKMKQDWVWLEKEKFVVDYVTGRLPRHGMHVPWSETDRVFGIGHVNRNHWVLYEMSILDEAIFVYDSLAGDGKRGNPRHLSHVRLLASLMPSIIDQLVKTGSSPKKSARGKKKAWDVKLIPYAPQQVDSSSCGVLSLKVLECLVSGHALDVIDPERCTEYRKRYCEELFNRNNISPIIYT